MSTQQEIVTMKIFYFFTIFLNFIDSLIEQKSLETQSGLWFLLWKWEYYSFSLLYIFIKLSIAVFQTVG